MIFHAFLIKYAEIAIKGKNRYLFEDALVKQMKLALEPVEGEFTVTKEQGRGCGGSAASIWYRRYQPGRDLRRSGI